MTFPEERSALHPSSEPATQAHLLPQGEKEDAEARVWRRGAIVIATLAAVVVVTCCGLGIWQLQRRVWKLDVIERVETRLAAAPVPAPGRAAWTSLDPAEAEYQRVTLAGTFQHDRETLVQAVTEQGPGFWVLTPLATDAGFTVLVNRGFAPPDRRNPTTRAEGNADGERRITGLLRLTEPGGGFLRSNDAAAGRWFSRDVSAIAAAKGLSDAAPYFVDADATPNPGGLPMGGLTVVSFRNPHLVYALTWFALALMAAGALVYLMRQERSHTPHHPA